MTQAVNINRLTPGTGWIYTRDNGSLPWTLSSMTVYPSVHHYNKVKPASIRTPKVMGWREPQPWNYIDQSLDLYFRDCYFHTKSKFSSSQALRLGVTNVASPPGTLPLDPPAALLAQCEMNALNRLRNDKVNLGVSFGERKEAANMMLANLGKIAKSYREFRRGNFRNAARSLGLSWRDAPNRWLEYQYGWKPLLSDIHTACEEISKKDIEAPKRTYYFIKETAVSELKDAPYSNWDGFAYIAQRNAKYEVQVRFDFSPIPEMRLFATLDEWGVTNPLLVAWELVPFSFVVDWAVPVGDFLAAITASKPYQLRGGSKSLFTRTATEAVCVKAPANASVVLDSTGHANRRICKFVRGVYYTWPFPDIKALSHSKYRSASSQAIATRTANALSILASAFK